MPPPNVSTLLPTLPVELLDKIVGILAKYTSQVSDSEAIYSTTQPLRHNLRDLTQCALVCQVLYAITKPYIFEHIHSVGLWGAKKDRLLCLIEGGLTPQSKAAQYVRSLNFDAYVSRGENPTAIGRDSLPLVISTFESFINLRYLHITGASTNHMGDMVLSKLMHAHLPRGVLRTVSVDTIPRGVTSSALITAPNLSTLAIQFMYPYRPSCLGLDMKRPSDLTTLALGRSREGVDLSFLDMCPKLQTLTLPRNTRIVPASPPSKKLVLDSSKLTNLYLHGCIPIFTDFCRQRRRYCDDSRAMFQDLQQLAVEVEDDELSDSLKEIITEAPALQRLQIYATDHHPPICLDHLALDRRFSDGTLRFLTHLKLHFCSLPDPAGYQASFQSLIDIFNAASQKNVMQSVGVLLYIDTRTVDTSGLIDGPCDALKPLGRILACSRAYPALETFQFCVHFIRGDAQMLERNDPAFLDEGMKELAERGDVKFVGSVRFV